MEPGICYIKEEFLLPEEKNGAIQNRGEGNKRKHCENNNDEDAAEQNAPNGNGTAEKYQKVGSKHGKRGQNKNRPVYKDDRKAHLCNSLINGPNEIKCANVHCRYVHDLAAYLTSKGDDLGAECPVFKVKGYCPRGVTCRFAKAHMDAEFKNIKAAHYDENERPTTINGITPELSVRLRKRLYDFTRSKNLISKFEKLREERKKKAATTQAKSKEPENASEEFVENPVGEVEDNTETAKCDQPQKSPIVEVVDDTETNGQNQAEELQIDLEKNQIGKVVEDSKTSERDPHLKLRIDISEKPIGAIIDDAETAGRDQKKKSPIDFSEKLMLSPLTTVGNLPFRRICKEFGADITCGEMACAVPLIKGFTQEWALTKRHASEDIFGVQLCGNNPTIVTQVAQLVQETTNVDFIDLNIGCPIELIYQQGGGSALMRRQNILELIVRSSAALSPLIPFTVKMRTGVYANKNVAHELVPLVEEWGAAAVTLHGRSREQRYTRNANWEYIEECASKAKHMPVIGNGDILNFQDYNEKRKAAPHIASVMIGRGALIKPWIFKEIKEQRHYHPSSSERFDILRKYVNYGLEHWGSDTKGVENTRHFLLEWLSFLYRYVPYDLMLNPPLKINQRPQKFRGRDELETLMCSPNSSDWVHLSEMLLGPVPQEFTFVPKHKANAY